MPSMGREENTTNCSSEPSANTGCFASASTGLSNVSSENIVKCMDGPRIISSFLRQLIMSMVNGGLIHTMLCTYIAQHTNVAPPPLHQDIVSIL